MRLRPLLAVVTVAVFVPGLTSCDATTPGTGVDNGSSASCAAIVKYHGHTYEGHGDLKRLPETTSRTEVGSIPPCDDGNGVEAVESVKVHELRDISIERALLVNGHFFLRKNAQLPKAARVWFSAQSCASRGRFELTGQWLSVLGRREVHFDADIRPPYHIELKVASGPHTDVGDILTIHATHQTDPQLGPADVRRTLWNGGDLTAQVHCDGKQLIADGLASVSK